MKSISRYLRSGLLLAAAGMATIASTAVGQEGFTDVRTWYTNSAPAATVGQYFKVTLLAYSGGWESATNVVVTNWCPAGLQLISASSSRGTCVATSGVVICNFGFLFPTASATVTMEFKALAVGAFTNTAVGSADNPDSNPANDQSSFTTLVTQAKFFGVGSTHAHYNDPTMTLMPNNQVLVTGHYGPYLGKTTDLYSVTSRTFTMPIGTMVEMHLGGSATLLNNGSVLLAGGGNPTGAKTAEVYNPATQLFHQVGDMLVYSYNSIHTTLQPDGTVLLCGGDLSTNELYNPVTETFSLAPTKQCAFNGIYLSTGKFFYMSNGRAYLYDTNTSTSVTASGQLQSQSYSSATLLQNGKVLIAGGWSGNVGLLSTAELYDPVTDTFTWTAPLTTQREHHTACLLPDGTVLLAGGSTSDNDPFSLTNAEVYDPNGAVSVPGVGVSDASVLEGNSGTTWLQFPVWLTATSSFPVTVNYVTAIGTAGITEWGVGNVDFIATNGTVTIPPGQTNGTISVPILGDLILESNETLSVTLSQPIQAWMARSTAVGTILNDDTTPTLSISPITPIVTERDSGVANLVYNVILAGASFDTVTVDYFTSDVTAQAGTDYVPITGTLTYQPGETNKVLIVPAIGDLMPEPDETLKLNLTNAQFALINVGQATGTILNDDGFAGAMHHFDIAPISGVKTQTFAFPVTITARDGFGNVVSNFSNPVRILSYTTNVVASNLDFEQSTLAPWTPLINGENPGPYEMLPYDVERNGRLSSAFRLRIDGGTDGISQNVQLTGGITYTLSVDMFSAQEGSGGWIGAQATLNIGNSNGYWNMPALETGQSARGRIEMPFTAPTNGIYTLKLIVGWGAPWFPVPGDYFFYADNVQIAYPTLTPTVLTNGFTNGVWTGTITPLQGASNVVLIADDTEGHKGSSNPIDILALADLTLTASSQVQGTPPLRTGMKLQYNLAVTNRGPSTPANTVVHCDLPANIAFISATNLLGTITTNGSAINWNISSLSPGSNVTAVIVCRANIPGDITNLFSVSAAPLDLNLVDNSVALSTHIDPPLLNISDASGTEAVASTNGMAFTLTLSGPSAQTISVDYFTADGTASNGLDYVGATSTAVFAPGITNTTVLVYALDDILDEPDRSFSVLLTNAVNAIISDGSGNGTVVDDDPPPAITIADTSVVEGDSGTKNAVFQLTLNKRAIVDVSVRCTAATNTASTNDFVSTVTTVVFPAGQTNTTFTVPVIGNTVNEPDETFFVNLSLPANATIARAQAVGTILNDDAVTGRLDHFVWDAIPSSPPHYRGLAFPVTLRAVDYLGNPASNGVSSAIVIARTENGFTNRLQDDFEDNDSLGWTNFNSSFTTVVTNETASQGSNSLRLTGSTVATTAGFRRSFSNSQPNRITFSVRVGRTNQVAGRFTAYGNGIYRSAVFYFDNKGQMGLMDPQRVLHGGPYQSNQWYHVDLYFNWASQKVDCRVDGALVATNIAFPESVTFMDAVVLANQDNTTSWFDDIRVYNDNLTNVFAVTPSNFTAFAIGVKSNAVAINGAGTNIYLAADDGFEHVGKSGFFDLLPVNLSLVTPPSLTEGSVPTNAQLTIPVAFPQAMTVNLTSTAPARLTMPATVIIAANQTNASFNLGIVDDAVTDWIKTVQISASGTNVDSTTNVITLVDNDPAMASIAQNGRMTNGGFQVGLQGPPAQNFVLFASTNLMDWTSISNITFSNGPVMFLDNAATNLDHRFYRLVPAGP